MGDFIKNSPFRFWCQKVLPLVYDDSLSYYELLCKVVGKLNELAENQNNLSDEIKAVAKDLDDFKAQVPDMVEAKVEEWLNNYIATHGLVNSVNGMTGVVTLTAADVGAIANVNGSVKNNNIADGAVTADKMAAGVIPTKLPNPQKLTFTGAVTGEYDGSQAVSIDIPAGGGGGGEGGGGAVDSVNGMTGAVVLKKLTAGEGLSMSGADGYNGSAERTVGIAPGGVSSDKIADNAITAAKIAGGVLPIINTYSKNITISIGKLYLFIGQVNKIYNVYASVSFSKSGKPTMETHTIDYPFVAIDGKDIGGHLILIDINSKEIAAELSFEFRESGCKVTIRWFNYTSIGSGIAVGSSTMGYIAK